MPPLSHDIPTLSHPETPKGPGATILQKIQTGYIDSVQFIADGTGGRSSVEQLLFLLDSKDSKKKKSNENPMTIAIDILSEQKAVLMNIQKKIKKQLQRCDRLKVILNAKELNNEMQEEFYLLYLYPDFPYRLGTEFRMHTDYNNAMNALKKRFFWGTEGEGIQEILNGLKYKFIVPEEAQTMGLQNPEHLNQSLLEALQYIRIMQEKRIRPELEEHIDDDLTVEDITIPEKIPDSVFEVSQQILISAYLPFFEKYIKSAENWPGGNNLSEWFDWVGTIPEAMVAELLQSSEISDTAKEMLKIRFPVSA